MQTLVQSPKALGRALRDARRRRGLTQQQLAGLVGVRQATVSNTERRAENVSLKTLLRILAALRLELILQTRESRPLATDWQEKP